MSNEERARILRMVSEGTVTPTEAEELLSALQSNPRSETASLLPSIPPRPPDPPGISARRSLIVHVNDGGHQRVNVRIPLGLAHAAGKFISRHTEKALKGQGIDLEELLAGLVSTEGSGTLLEVQDATTQVRIAVE